VCGVEPRRRYFLDPAETVDQFGDVSLSGGLLGVFQGQHQVPAGFEPAAVKLTASAANTIVESASVGLPWRAGRPIGLPSFSASFWESPHPKLETPVMNAPPSPHDRLHVPHSPQAPAIGPDERCGRSTPA